MHRPQDDTLLTKEQMHEGCLLTLHYVMCMQLTQQKKYLLCGYVFTKTV